MSFMYVCMFSYVWFFGHEICWQLCDSHGCHEISIMAETKTKCFGLTKCPPQAANPTHHSFHPHGSSSAHAASLSTHCHSPSLVLSTSKAIPLSCKEQPPLIPPNSKLYDHYCPTIARGRSLCCAATAAESPSLVCSSPS